MSTRIVTDQKARPISAMVAWVVAILTAGYMLPWAVALVMVLNPHNLIAIQQWGAHSRGGAYVRRR